MSSPAVSESQITVRAVDGYPLGARLFRPAAAPRCAVVIVPGVAIASGLYSRFARFLAAAGLGVLQFDFRGIGWSRPERLRGFPATLEDWSEFDAAAAIQRLHAEFPDTQAVGVGHSFGAMLLVAAPNAGSLARLVMVAPHTGYFGDYRAGYRWPMALLWHGLMPLAARAFGYFPARWLGLGGDVPAGVALQWASRRRPDINFAAVGDPERGRRLFAGAGDLALKTLALTFEDDAFAPRQGAERFLALAPRLAITHWVIHPAEAHLSRIGHFGFFRASAEKCLWEPVLAYLLRQPGSGPMSLSRRQQ